MFAPSSRRPRIHLISFPRLGKKSRRRRRTKRGMLDSPRSNRFVLFFVPSLRKVADTRRDALEIEPANIRGGRGGILKHFQYSTATYTYILYVYFITFDRSTLPPPYLSINLPVQRINFEARPSMIYLSSLSFRRGNPMMKRMHVLCARVSREGS